jgi:hypothetical protein
MMHEISNSPHSCPSPSVAGGDRTGAAIIPQDSTRLTLYPRNNSGPQLNDKIELNEFSKSILNNRELFYKDSTICLKQECNHEEVNIALCKAGCKFCTNWNAKIPLPNGKFNSYCCGNEPGINCKTGNVVYAITCECSRSYIGETKRSACDRWKEHLTAINKVYYSNPTGESNSMNIAKQLFYEHFRNKKCNPTSLKFGILMVIPRNDAKLREFEENFFIRMLNTAFPFGFNQKIKFFGNIYGKNSNNKLANHPYFNLRMKRKPRSHGERKYSGRKPKRTSGKVNNNLLNYFINANGEQKRHFNFKTLNKNTMAAIAERMNKRDSFKLVIECLIHENKKMEIPKKDSMFVQYEFINSCIDKIGIAQIFRKELRNKGIDLDDRKYPKITVTYSYKPKISRYLHNQKRFIESLDENKITEILKRTDCCYEIPNTDCKEGHLASGKLEYLPDALQNALKYGNNYRPDMQMHQDQVWDDINKFYDINANRVAKRFKISLDDAKMVVENANNTIRDKFSKIYNQNMVNTTEISSRELYDITKFCKNEISNSIILCDVDKCTNNTAIICSKLYTKKLCEDLGIEVKDDNTLAITGNDTFKPSNLNLEDIILRHRNIYRRYMGKDIPVDHRKIPTYYLIPKFHKPGDQCKTRPISSSRETCLAECAGLAAKCLNHLRQHFINITNLEKHSKGLSTIKSINSTDLLLEELDNIEELVTPHTINTYDFKSVFTSFKFSSIMEAMIHVVNKCFNSKVGSDAFLVIGYKKCYYSSNSNVNGIKLKKEEILDLIQTLLNESYIKVGSLIFNQIKGIPMGSKSSAILCDLSLISFEDLFMSKEGYKALKGVRYQDDILIFDHANFINLYSKIYPRELELEQDNDEDGKKVNYLDTCIRIENGRIFRTLYDKRDSFNFDINSLFNAKSNVRDSLISNVAYAQIIRIYKINNTVIGLINGLNRLRMQLRQNSHCDRVFIEALQKVGKNRIELLHKFMLHCEKSKTYINRLIRKLDSFPLAPYNI